MNGKTALRIFAFVLFAVIAGIVFVACKAGVANDSPVTVNAPESQIFSTTTVPATSVHSADTVTPFRIFATATLTSPAATALLPQPTNTTILASKPLIPSPTFTPVPTATPVLDETSSFCRNKKPTNLIFVNPNATFELLQAQNLKYGQQVLKTLGDGAQVLYSIQTDGKPGERVRCFNEGTKEDGRKIVACVGIVKMSYDLKVCDPTRPNCLTYKLVLPHCPGNPAW